MLKKSNQNIFLFKIAVRNREKYRNIASPVAIIYNCKKIKSKEIIGVALLEFFSVICLPFIFWI